MISNSVSNDVILGDVPEPIFSLIRNPVLAAISFPFGPGAFNQIGYLPHNKTYNANQGLTLGTGSLLSDDGLYFVDLSQFTGSTLPIIDQIMTGPGAHARACLVATPAQCTDVTLLRQ